MAQTVKREETIEEALAVAVASGKYAKSKKEQIAQYYLDQESYWAADS